MVWDFRLFRLFGCRFYGFIFEQGLGLSSLYELGSGFRVSGFVLSFRASSRDVEVQRLGPLPPPRSYISYSLVNRFQ